MIFKSAFLKVLTRVLLIVSFSIGMIYTHLATELSITPYMFGGLLLISSIEMVWFLQHQERNWAQFLHSVKFADFNRGYQYKTHTKALQEAYDLITDQLHTLQTNQAAEFKLLQTVLRHISIAVICCKENGEVVFTNKTFHDLLAIHEITQLSHLKKAHPAVHSSIISPDAGDKVVQLTDGRQLMISTEQFKLKGNPYFLASFTDVGNTLEGKALTSYQQLLRVMTHEIMNSTTPILSLIRVVNKKLIKDQGLIELSDNDQKNTAKSLQAIEERTEGILQFVEAYKRVNQAIEPRIEKVNSTELLNSVLAITAKTHQVPMEILDTYQADLAIDRPLMTQVLINLIKNAQEAVAQVDKPSISLRITDDSQYVRLSVEDNGPGVPTHQIDEIFVPFFTTKAGGSGIGLSLSRNIIFAHKGTLTYHRVNNNSQFIIRLPMKTK